MIYDFVKALFDDDEVANSLESLAGTLKAAKRQDKNVKPLIRFNLV